MMHHLSQKNDWYYEWKPYFIIGAGIFGIMTKSMFGLPLISGMFSFLSALILLGSGGYILQARKVYRKKSIMTMSGAKGF